VDGYLEGASVSEIDDSDGIGEAEGRLGNGGARIEVVAMRSLGSWQQFGPHLEVEKAGFVWTEDGPVGHVEVEPTVRAIDGGFLGRHVQGQEARIGNFYTEGFHSGD
jgi:hypothetical protein